MQYKSGIVKTMRAAEIREELVKHIEAVQPNAFGEVITDTLITAIRTKSTDISQPMRLFMGAETQIANQTGDYRIHDMIQYLRQVDRHVTRNKVRT